MIGAGTILNPIIKIVTTVAILGAIYLFFVKPTLETTENLTDRAFDTSNNISESIQRDIRESFRGVPDTASIQRQLQRSLDGASASQGEAQKLLTCIQKANQDIGEITRCNERYSF